MKTITIIDRATGLPRRIFSGPEHAFEMQLADDEFYVDGALPLLAARVDPDTLAVQTIQPTPPSADFELDALTGTFRPTEAARVRADAVGKIRDLEARQARAIREHAIGRGGTPAQLKKRLEDIDDEIIALRAQLT
jgi:hypothetical protein